MRAEIRSRFCFVAVLLIAAGINAPASDDGTVGVRIEPAASFTPDGAVEPNYGTTSLIREVLGSNTFGVRFSTTTWAYPAGVARHLTTSGFFQS